MREMRSVISESDGTVIKIHAGAYTYKSPMLDSAEGEPLARQWLTVHRLFRLSLLNILASSRISAGMQLA